MKNPVAKTEKANKSSSRLERSQIYALWGIKPRIGLGKLPTPENLAMVARAAGTSAENPKKLWSNALESWFALCEAIRLQKLCNKDAQLRNAELEAANKKLPPESEFPMTLDKCLQYRWPKKLAGERVRIFKAWLGSIGEPVEKRYADAFKQISQERFCFLRDQLREFDRVSTNIKSKNAEKFWLLCGAEEKQNPKFKEFEQVCAKRKKKPYRRYFNQWLATGKFGTGKGSVKFEELRAAKNEG